MQVPSGALVLASLRVFLVGEGLGWATLRFLAPEVPVAAGFVCVFRLPGGRPRLFFPDGFMSGASVPNGESSMGPNLLAAGTRSSPDRGSILALSCSNPVATGEIGPRR
ncbi:hypothetical protein F2Q70_00037898 [Brassica cretica]|uniref:Uncharacterized protein n=1 Tax=Brassica cretica TaxID=69181 RepID=A0A8S9JZ37_BRACR|nr:hypothetical protein F2Q70_00037898 [Brassica cretica]